ncbi:MAG: extracellular solute-binding protein [Clostridia bacterium]|nr:extracellular solute-binding protein [Clostridia bacterium]
MKRKQIIFSAVSTLLAVTLLLSGCNTGNQTTNNKNIDLSSYPIKTDTELTYWMTLDANIAASSKEFANTIFAQEIASRTGVKVKYIHPAMGQEAEAFSLMIASNELPDIIEYNWAKALGGPSSSINDKIIIPLNDLLPEYAPSLNAFLKENPDIDKMVKTDEGQYYVFPFIREDPYLSIPIGPIIRRDWLEELGLETPVTTADWENMLIQFRDKKGAAAPLTATGLRYILFLVGCTNEFYIDNGKVKFGPAEPEYKEGLTILHRWFETGLLDKNYVSTDRTMQDANMLNDKSGATLGAGGSGLGKWLETMAPKNTSFDLVGVRYPIVKEGDKARFGPFESAYPMSNSAAITTACKTPELAAKLLDYTYTEEGHILTNFGVEGKSFNYVDGYPTYSEIVTNNPDGLTMNQALTIYSRANVAGPCINDKRYLEQFYAKPQQKEALNAWLESYDASMAALMPSVSLTPEESQDYANLYNEIQKCRDTMSVSFISGVEPLSNFDKYIDQLKQLGLDKVLEIQQAAYDRYVKR